MKKSLILIVGMFLAGFYVAPVAAEDDPRIKVLMQEALKLYGDRQYIRANDLFKQVLRIEPDHNLAQEYVKSSEQKINEGAVMGGEATPSSRGITWDSLLDSRSETETAEVENARDIIAARKSLVERMKNRSMNTDNIVKIEESKRGLEVILYHDQLFLPGLLTLRDGSLLALEKVAQLIQESRDKDVTLYSLARHDSNDPFLLYPDFPVPARGPGGGGRLKEDAGPSFNFQDIEASRSFILFTYLAQRGMGDSSLASQK